MMTTGERLELLLAQRVTEGLSAEGEAELTLLLGEDPSMSDEVRRWEVAAAATAQSFVAARASAVAIPPGLARRLTEEAELFVAAASRSSRKAAGAKWMTTGAASAAEMPSVRPLPETPRRVPFAWWAAAAALVLCAGQTWRLHQASAIGAASAAGGQGEIVQARCTSDPGGLSATLSWDARARTGTFVVSPAPSSRDAVDPVRYRCEAALP